MGRPALVVSLLSGAVLAATTPIGIAQAQTRGECEAGIAFIRDALSQQQSPATRTELEKALRDAQRELGEREYDECMEAVEDARAVVTPGAAARAPGPVAEDERVGADEDFPVTAESAFVPDRGEFETRFNFRYSRLSRVSTAPDGGRDLYTPEVELELGLGNGLSASISGSYGLGNTDNSNIGDVGFSLKWNFLPSQGMRPALTLVGGVSQPFGPGRGSAETGLALLVSQPLGAGINAPWLHVNFAWLHALEGVEDDERRDRYAAAVALAVPLTRTTGFLLGFSREQETERRQAEQFVEFGLRQLLPGGFLLAGGAGIGVGDSSTDYRLRLGIQKGF